MVSMIPTHIELWLLSVTAAFAFVMTIQWFSQQFEDVFVGYFLVFFIAFVILQGSIPDWLFARMRRRRDGAYPGEDGSDEGEAYEYSGVEAEEAEHEEDKIRRDVEDMAQYRMVNVVFSNWSIWLLCGAIEVFTWAFVRVNRPVEISISVVMMIATTLFFFGRRFLLSDDFPRIALVILYTFYYVLCIIPVSYNNALLSSTFMTAMRQVYYAYVCLLYFYLVPARNRTSRASSMVATTHLIYPLYGNNLVLVVGLVPAAIMTYMAARKIRPYVKGKLRILNDKMDRIRQSRDVFDFSHQEESVLDEEDPPLSSASSLPPVDRMLDPTASLPTDLLHELDEMA